MLQKKTCCGKWDVVAEFPRQPRLLSRRSTQCLRPYVSIHRAQRAHIHIKCRLPRCLRTTRRVPREKPFVCSVRSEAESVSDSPVGGNREALICAASPKLLDILETGRCGSEQTEKPMAEAPQGHMVTERHTCVELWGPTPVAPQVELKVHRGGRAAGLRCSPAMNQDNHFYPSQVFKDSCAYQRPQGEDYSPPPCLYMSRQVHSIYTPPALGPLEQAGLTDIASAYSLPNMREDPGVPQLHHPQGLQQPPLQPPGYGDTEQSRYHLPFPWMKTTKSHSHTWKGQWTGKTHTCQPPRPKTVQI